YLSTFYTNLLEDSSVIHYFLFVLHEIRHLKCQSDNPRSGKAAPFPCRVHVRLPCRGSWCCHQVPPFLYNLHSRYFHNNLLCSLSSSSHATSSKFMQIYSCSNPQYQDPDWMPHRGQAQPSPCGVI